MYTSNQAYQQLIGAWIQAEAVSEPEERRRRSRCATHPLLLLQKRTFSNVDFADDASTFVGVAAGVVGVVGVGVVGVVAAGVVAVVAQA